MRMTELRKWFLKRKRRQGKTIKNSKETSPQTPLDKLRYHESRLQKPQHDVSETKERNSTREKEDHSININKAYRRRSFATPLALTTALAGAATGCSLAAISFFPLALVA